MSENCLQKYCGQTKHGTSGSGTGTGTGDNIHVLRGVLAMEETGKEGKMVQAGPNELFDHY